MSPDYFIVVVVFGLVIYFAVRIIRGDRCPGCRALLDPEIGEKRVMANRQGIEWDTTCSNCGYTETDSEEGLDCMHCEHPTATVESSYTGANGFELRGIRCLNCGHAWKQELDYSQT